jgi:hypothetical protein
MLTVHKLRLFSDRVEYTVVLDQLDTEGTVISGSTISPPVRISNFMPPFDYLKSA